LFLVIDKAARPCQFLNVNFKISNYITTNSLKKGEAMNFITLRSGTFGVSHSNFYCCLGMPISVA
jgi:hypothetical protein